MHVDSLISLHLEVTKRAIGDVLSLFWFQIVFLMHIDKQKVNKKGGPEQAFLLGMILRNMSQKTKLNIAINGFGRIGRVVLRRLIQEPNLHLVAINDLTDAKTLAHLVKYDSIHGKFQGKPEHC